MDKITVRDAMEDIDAALFVGDYFEDQTERTLLRSMTARWERRMKEIEDNPAADPEPPPSRPKADTVLGSHLRISIESIPHKQQRYNTCGDYFEASEGEGVVINVSELPSRREMILVAIHELIEWALCEAEGISIQEIDNFDLHYCGEGLPEEPGDCDESPYYKQHQIASGIERLLAAEMGVDWLTYERHVAELDYSQPVEPLPYDDDIPF